MPHVCSHFGVCRCRLFCSLKAWFLIFFFAVAATRRSVDLDNLFMTEVLHLRRFVFISFGDSAALLPSALKRSLWGVIVLVLPF